VLKHRDEQIAKRFFVIPPQGEMLTVLEAAASE
jgi:hypothetical protein